jgi:hypothetical protein
MVFFFSSTTLETRRNLSRDFPPFCVESLLGSTGGQYSTLFLELFFFAKKGRKINQTNPIYTKNIFYKIISK